MQKIVAEVASEEFAQAVEAERLQKLTADRRKLTAARLGASAGGRPAGRPSTRGKERPVALQAALARLRSLTALQVYETSSLPRRSLGVGLSHK